MKLSERCWIGPLSLVSWAIIVLLVCLPGRCHGAECRLEWEAAGDASEWRVYRGIDLLATVTEPRATVTLPDAPCEVAVVAINDAGTSPPATLKLAFVVMEQSNSLREWRRVSGIHREFAPPKFYRLRIETP